MKIIKNNIKEISFFRNAILLVLLVFTACDDTDYIVLGKAPQQITVTNIDPIRGDIGFEVIISGTNFSPVAANNKVEFNGVLATVTSATSEAIIVTVPEGATTGEVLINLATFSASAGNFEVVQIPTITEVSPTGGGEGEEVILTGTRFSTTPTENILNFNGVSAVVTEATDTSITTTVPEGATTGDINLTVNGETAISENFVLEPRITDFSPIAGPVGTQVLISGTSFSAILEDNQVEFNGTTAVVTTVTTTSITTTVPEGATTGIVSVTVNGFAIDGEEFTVGILPTTLTIPLESDDDDVEEIVVLEPGSTSTLGEMDLGSSDLELGETSSGQGLLEIGVRFNNVMIPTGATVTNAQIQFRCDNTGADPVEITVYGENAGNAAAYTADPFNVTSRALTTANAIWSIPEWVSTGDRLPAQQTIDLSSIVQEIINRPDWVSGNSINFILRNTGVSATATSTSGGRETENYSSSTPEDGAELTVSFQ